MRLLLVLLFTFHFANAVEISIKENGTEKVVKIPDNPNQDIILKIDTKNANSISDLCDTVTTKVATKQKQKAKTKAKMKNIATKANAKKSIKNKIKTATSVYSNLSTTQAIMPRDKNIQLINVYHYFYPCSANPKMPDCVRDEQIKIDNNTSRLVIEDKNGTRAVDLIDQKQSLISVPAKQNQNSTQNTTNSTLQLQQYSESQSDNNGSQYQNFQMQNESKAIKILPTYTDKKVAIVK